MPEKVPFDPDDPLPVARAALIPAAFVSESPVPKMKLL
jgi:hypothetical protein